MIVIDVNVLAYVANQRDPRHDAVYAWWTRTLRGNESLALPWIVISGFLRISTDSRIFEKPLSAEQALGRVESWLDHPNVGVASENEHHWPTFRALIQEMHISGKAVTDAHLAALAITRRAALASCDRDFARFRQLRWVNPAV
jgi:toxin-antitoxin system PIN domain toxin